MDLAKETHIYVRAHKCDHLAMPRDIDIVYGQ